MIRFRVFLPAVLACLMAEASSLGAQRPLNLDFETRSVIAPERPWGWYSSDLYNRSPQIQVTLDESVRRQGQKSLRVERAHGAPIWSAYHFLPVEALPGRRYRLSGWVRTQGLIGGRAVLRVETFGPRYARTALDTMAGRGLSGSTKWTRLSLEGMLPSSATGLGFGVQLSGNGKAWFDDFVFEMDGQRVTQEKGPPSVTPAQAAWLRQRVIPLKTVEPGTDETDLAPLRKLVGDARIVSLGEGTHGSREFFQLKHRMIEHLVRRAGFSVVMLEANQLQAEKLNRYVLYGEGSAREALGTVFRILRTEEMLALVEWVRAYNVSGQGRVEVVGYDMQDPRYAIDSVIAFLRRHDTAFAATADSAYRDMREAWRPAGYPARPDSIVHVWQRHTSRVLKHIRNRYAAYLSAARTRSDSVAIEWAVQSAEIAYQSASLGDDSPHAVRDSAMAANIDWLLRQRPPGTRAIVWAHNFHVARNPGVMGEYLERVMPGQTRVFGFTTSGGEYTASAGIGPDARFGAFRITPSEPPSSSIAYVLSKAGHPVSVVDLRAVRGDLAGAWLVEPRPFIFFGGAASDYGYVAEPVARAYDFLVHVRRTAASRLLQ